MSDTLDDHFVHRGLLGERRRRPAAPRGLAAALVSSVLVAACSPQHECRVELTPEEEAVLAAERAHWVKWYQPEQSSSGFNLVLHKRRTPMIRDMNGRQVHAWPNVRATGRVRLSREGRLVVIGTDHQISEYDWSGEPIRNLPLLNEDDLPHHDLIELGNGNYLLLALQERDAGDYLLEVDREGREVWEWRAIDHRDAFPAWNLGDRDPTHINSVRELPYNRWFDDGDERFRPGNILASARNQHTLFIIDKFRGSVVWEYSDRLDHQHEAIMLGKELESAGLILVFNNGRNDLYEYRSSSVLLIDPIEGEVVWQYRSNNFFSSHTGVAQPLPNGNVLITSSNGGRVFEVTPESRVVWEWVPNYAPVRVERLAYDHCPQLAALTPKIEVEVSPDAYRPHVDRELYELDVHGGTKERQLWGRTLTPLKWRDGCRQLRIPEQAVMKIEFGFDEERLGKKPASAVFGVTVRDEEGRERLVEKEMGSESDSGLWQRRRIDLTGYAQQSVELCLSVQVTQGGKRAEKAALWGVPVIEKKRRSTASVSETEEPISGEERELRRRQMEALGYVN